MSVFFDTTKFVPGRVRRWALRRLLDSHFGEDVVRLGSEHGGWYIPASLLDSNSICYFAGVGEDATFDFAVIEQYGCTVHAFDPTPESHSYIDSLPRVPSGFVFHRYGVWSEDTNVRFYAPQDPHVDISHSALNLQGTEDYFEGPVRSIRSIMNELGHHHIDLLKLDIEGAEHTVLEHLQREHIWPRVLCIEFDQPYPLADISKRVRMLASHGYTIAKTERWNFTFVRSW